jgi:hypothetical protein
MADPVPRSAPPPSSWPPEPSHPSDRRAAPAPPPPRSSWTLPCPIDAANRRAKGSRFCNAGRAQAYLDSTTNPCAQRPKPESRNPRAERRPKPETRNARAWLRPSFASSFLNRGLNGFNSLTAEYAEYAETGPGPSRFPRIPRIPRIPRFSWLWFWLCQVRVSGFGIRIWAAGGGWYCPDTPGGRGSPGFEATAFRVEGQFARHPG